MPPTAARSPIRQRAASRVIALAAALAIIGLGLGVHRMAPPGAGRDIAGDALWAAMMVAWVSVLVPGRSTAWRAGVALLVCWVVEVSQLARWPWLMQLRATWWGPLVLGSGFDPRDLLSYAVGVALAWVIARSVGGGVAPA